MISTIPLPNFMVAWLTKFSCRLLSWICQSTNGLVKIRLRLGLRLWLGGDTSMYCIDGYNVQVPLFTSKICDTGDLYHRQVSYSVSLYSCPRQHQHIGPMHNQCRAFNWHNACHLRWANASLNIGATSIQR